MRLEYGPARRHSHWPRHEPRPSPGLDPRPYSVQQHIVLEWLRRVVEHRAFVTASQVNAPDLEAEDDRLARLEVAREFMGPEDYERLRTTIEQRIAAMRADTEPGHRVVALGIDWTLPAPDLNARLQAIIARVELAADMRPVAVIYREQPLIEDPDVDPEVHDGPPMVPDPRAQRVSDGWRVAHPCSEGRHRS